MQQQFATFQVTGLDSVLLHLLLIQVGGDLRTFFMLLHSTPNLIHHLHHLHTSYAPSLMCYTYLCSISICFKSEISFIFILLTCRSLILFSIILMIVLLFFQCQKTEILLDFCFSQQSQGMTRCGYLYRDPHLEHTALRLELYLITVSCVIGQED